MQKSEIADSVSLLTGCTAIFDFYTAKAVHEQVAKRIANVAWRSVWRKPYSEKKRSGFKLHFSICGNNRLYLSKGV